MRVKKQLIKREIAGDVILVPVGKTVLDNNGLFILNEVSGDIWDMLCQGKDRAEIVEAIAQDYDAPREVIESDTDAFLDQLVKLDILEL